MTFDLSQLENFRPTLTSMGEYVSVERVTGEWLKAGRLSPDLIDALQKNTIITSSGSSTRIENALMGDDEVAAFLKKGCKITAISSRSEREVAGYIKVLEYLYAGGSEDPVSEHSIKAFHQLMTETFTNDMLPAGQRGAYKNVTNDVVERNEETGEEKVWFQTVPPGPQTGSAMAELVKKYDDYCTGASPRLIVIGWFIVHFLAIHPFRDGNGRLSRLLTIWLLLKNGYSWLPYVSHEKFIEDNKERYYLSLRDTQQSFRQGNVDYEPWLSFFGSILAKQAHYLEKNVLKIASDSIKQLGKNERAVYLALRDSGPMSRGDLEKAVSMSEKGMKLLLRRLLDREKIQRTGQGRATKYLIQG